MVLAALMFYEDRPQYRGATLVESQPTSCPRKRVQTFSDTGDEQKRIIPDDFWMVFGWFWMIFGWFLMISNDFKADFLGTVWKKTCRWQNFEFVVGIAPSGQLSLDCKLKNSEPSARTAPKYTKVHPSNMFGWYPPWVMVWWFYIFVFVWAPPASGHKAPSMIEWHRTRKSLRPGALARSRFGVSMRLVF